MSHLNTQITKLNEVHAEVNNAVKIIEDHVDPVIWDTLNWADEEEAEIILYRRASNDIFAI